MATTIEGLEGTLLGKIYCEISMTMRNTWFRIGSLGLTMRRSHLIGDPHGSGGLIVDQEGAGLTTRDARIWEEEDSVFAMMMMMMRPHFDQHLEIDFSSGHLFIKIILTGEPHQGILIVTTPLGKGDTKVKMNMSTHQKRTVQNRIWLQRGQPLVWMLLVLSNLKTSKMHTVLVL